MNTNQDTTLTNQDAFEVIADIVGLDTAVLGNSKTREFEYADISTHRAYLCHLAATQASESEINSLKERVEELEAANSCLVRINVSLAKESEELAASNNKLREALEKTWSRPKLQNEIDNILSSTPAQSMQEHDNDVIERIATALENAEGEFKTLPEYVSLVRALKATP